MTNKCDSWFKSSYSNHNDACVEVRLGLGGAQVRDTKANGTGPELTFTGPEWDAFIAGAKNGEFDRR